MIARWPARLDPGTSDLLITHADLLATFADLFDQVLPAQAARDSISVVPSLDEAALPTRAHLVEHGSRRSAIRQGDWKLIFDNDFQAGPNARRRLESVELYNLGEDPSESTNVADGNPEKVKELQSLLHQIKKTGDREIAAASPAR
jgi:arylsulfatase A-like enzyme